MLTMSDGGNVTVRIEKGKIILALVDNGGLDLSPPDGAEIKLDAVAAHEISKELEYAAETVFTHGGDVSLDERRTRILSDGRIDDDNSD